MASCTTQALPQGDVARTLKLLTPPLLQGDGHWFGFVYLLSVQPHWLKYPTVIWGGTEWVKDG